MGSAYTPASRRLAAGKAPVARSGGGLTANQKGLFALAAILVGPALLKKAYEQPKSEVDLSAWKIVTKYDTPAIDRKDGTLRIEFCAS